MIKYIDVSPFDINGNPTTVEVRPGYGMQKIAKYETLMQDMRDYIANIKPREGKAFLLIAAMGDQNWGSNKNADFWPTEALSHEGHDYGYLTFEDNGHWYHQHNNKDPEKSYGKVIKSIYNPQMCRIELIVEVDLTKDDVIREKLANNELIQVSMGGSVSYDLCKVCHPNWLAFYNVAEPDMVKLAKADSLDEVYEIGKRNGVDLSYITELNPDGGPVGIHSKVSKYCHHMKYARNRLLSSGERACVINLRPKFFDISWVNTNADKSAFVLDKVAAEIGEANEQEIVKRLAENEKRAEEKRAIEDKKADIDKEIPGEVISDDADLIKEYYAKRLLPEIVPYEKEIPDDVIDRAAKKYSLGEILSTFMIMGMFPHPREFQRIVLIQTGDDENLRAMDNPENVLTPAILNAIAGDTGRLPEMDFGIGHNNINGDLASLLQQFMPQRSYYRPHVAKRIIMIKKAEYKRVNSYITPDTKPPKVIPALLAAIGGIYMAAKLTGDKGLNDLVASAQQNKLPVLAGLAGAALLYQGIRAHNREMGANVRFNRFQEMEKERRAAERMQKMSSFGTAAASVGLPILGAYLWAGHSINKMQRGEDPGSIGTFVAKYPLVAGIAGAALVNPASRNAMTSVLRRNKGAAKPAAEAVTETASKAARNPGTWKKLLLPTASVAAPIVGTHAIAANTINKAQEGKPYSKTEAFVTKHPLALGALGAAALTPPVRNAVVNWGKYMVKGAEHKLYNLQELDPIEQDKLICAYWEYGADERNLS
jgi:hypothetical protein